MMPFISKSHVKAVVLTFLASTAFVVQASAATILQPHRSVYEINLDKAEERTGIDAMDGRLVFEVQGGACDGYTTNMRFVLRMQLPDALRVTDQQTATYEAGDGSAFSFVTRTFTDQRLDREIKGSASVNKDGIAINLEKPEPLDVTVERSQFPTMHLKELLEKAEAGETFYETTLYDGSDDADRLILTSVAIGKKTVEADVAEGAAEKLLEGQSFWPVSIAYFDPMEETGGESLPQYRINFKMYENGITRDLVLDYGDFVLNGKMSSLELLEVPEAC